MSNQSRIEEMNAKTWDSNSEFDALTQSFADNQDGIQEFQEAEAAFNEFQDSEDWGDGYEF